jgi:hypothetical protein
MIEDPHVQAAEGVARMDVEAAPFGSAHLAVAKRRLVRRTEVAEAGAEASP